MGFGQTLLRIKSSIFKYILVCLPDLFLSMKLTLITRVLFSVIIFLFCFPVIDPTFSVGIDPSLPFAFNYFFHFGIHFGTNVIFTYGPLAFLKMPIPMGNHLVIAIGFISILYLSFIYSLLYLGHIINKEKWLLHIGISILVCQICYLDHLLVGLTALSLLIHHERNNRIWLFVAVLSSLFGFYIKSSIGIISLLVLFSYILLYYYHYRDFKQPLLIVVGIIGFYFIIWAVIYHTLYGSVNFFVGTLQLAKDNSAASSFYPPNNWWLLGTAILSFFAVPVFGKNNKIYFFYGILFLSVFAAWKHSYSREEEVHLQSFYDFLILFFSMFLVYIERVRPMHIVLISVSLFTLYRNMFLTGVYHQDDRIQLNGINTFYETFFEYKNYVNKSNGISAENSRSRRLPPDVLNLIDSATVDVYPWDFSYIAANNLKWKPRPIMQSYAAYTQWLDDQDAHYFSSPNSAQFIVWELTSDRYGQMGFSSIDNRYLLNDEPNAIYQFFNHYKPVYKNNEIILFKKTEKEHLLAPAIIKVDSTEWNHWVAVPKTGDGIIRAKTFFSKNVLGFLKAFIYKDEESRMDCKLKNGNVVQYRIVPNSAERGLWITPLFTGDVNKITIDENEVDEIRFSNSNKNLMKEKIVINWELIEVNPKQVLITDSVTLHPFHNQAILNYFLKYKKLSDTLLFHSLNNFEKECIFWKGNPKNSLTNNYFSGKKSEQLNPEDIYSSTLKYPIGKHSNDSTSLKVNVSVWVKMLPNSAGTIVISLENDKGVFLWHPRRLQSYMIDRSEWQQIFFNEEFKSIPYDSQLGTYVITEGKDKIWLDDFDVKIIRTTPN